MIDYIIIFLKKIFIKLNIYLRNLRIDNKNHGNILLLLLFSYFLDSEKKIKLPNFNKLK